jgi:hypothetical protein
MTDDATELTDDMVAAKWQEIAPLIELVTARIQDPDDFTVQPGSQLAEDDADSHPYEVSHCARWCLNAGVDHLHALKLLVIDDNLIHAAASYSLARGALENFAAGFWVLHSDEPAVRIEVDGFHDPPGRALSSRAGIGRFNIEYPVGLR